MTDILQAIRGMNDVLPDESYRWQYVESILRDIMAAYCYEEIRMPVLEPTALFKRSIGEVTDIVEKEMYTFADRNGDLLSLRPEGTASCVRACIEHNLLYQQAPRLWYIGPMYRYERPQKGRYRQFYQFGIEALGFSSPNVDVEVMAIAWRILKALNLMPYVKLEINSLGTPQCRKQFRQTLVDYFTQYKDQLDEDSLRRLGTNPLRILDSKNPSMQALIEDAPKLADSWNDEAKAHFAAVCVGLEAVGIEYKVNSRLVRGLDYYTHTVFEWTTDQLGAQSAVCAGGRYDGLVTQLGGKDTPAVGFSLGIERLLMLFELQACKSPHPHVYLMSLGDEAQRQALCLAEELRTQFPALRVHFHATDASLKSQFKRADKLQADVAIVLGETELAQGVFGYKHLKKAQEQQSLTKPALIHQLQQEFLQHV